MDIFFEIDRHIFYAINNLAGSFIDYPMAVLAFITRTRWLMPLTALGIFVFSKEQKYKRIWITLAFLFLLDHSVLFLKYIIGMPRPFEVYDQVHIVTLFGIPQSPSFPSGHASMIFGWAVLLHGIFRKPFWWAYLIAVIVAVGRVYLGLHYPSDVLTGILVGSGSACLLLKYLSSSRVPAPAHYGIISSPRKGTTHA